MKIKAHKLVDAAFRQANSFGGEMKPTLIVVHDTAGRLDKYSSVDWFASPDCPTSAHVVIERDGSIIQMVPFNRKAWHAGPSSWKGRDYCNSYAIGIEIVNPGKLDVNGRAWFHKGKERGFSTASLKHIKTREHGDGWWMGYTDEQIASVTNLCKALCGAYEITDITTHWAISPGRKVDTNPLFPLNEVRHAALSAEDEPISLLSPTAPEDAPKPSVVATAAKSKTVRLGIGGIFAWIEAKWEVVRGVLPDWKDEFEALSDPLTDLGKVLKVNMSEILLVLGLLLLVTIILRHVAAKRELQSLKGE